MDKKFKICLLTPAQPSINPRLVKEADALAEAGYDVHVLGAHYVAWAAQADKLLLASRQWSYAYIGGVPSRFCLRYWWTRLRHGLAKKAVARNIQNRWLRQIAPSRVSPELGRAAKATPADLFIAHNLAALPLAVAAARKNKAKVGFDAEDFHSGMDDSAPMAAIIESIEREYLPQCDYLTAGSPQIAQAYAEKYQIPAPVPILNVFPLQEQPLQFRPSTTGALKLYWFSQTIGANRGLEDVVRALGRLPGCDIELHLRGAWQSGYQETLLALAQSVGVSAAKIIAHAPAPADDMARLAAEYDIGLALEPAANLNNGIALSNKAFTYLLAGNAVIATATSAQKAFINAIGEAGFCYQPGDVEALAAQLKYWHDDREALETARRQAWERAITQYNWDVEKHKFLSLIEKTLQQGAAG